MTGSTTSAGQLKFKAPGSAEWCALPVEGEDKDQQQKTKTARDSLKETLLTSLQMQHIGPQISYRGRLCGILPQTIVSS